MLACIFLSVLIVNNFHWFLQALPAFSMLEPISSLFSWRTFLPYSKHAMVAVCHIRGGVESAGCFCRSSKICPAWLFRLDQGQMFCVQLCCFTSQWKCIVCLITDGIQNRLCMHLPANPRYVDKLQLYLYLTSEVPEIHSLDSLKIAFCVQSSSRTKKSSDTCFSFWSLIKTHTRDLDEI